MIWSEAPLVVHKYRILKTSWGIAINIYGTVYDYDRYIQSNGALNNDNVSKICDGVSVLFAPEKNENVGPHDAYNQMHPNDYPYMVEGLKNVSEQIRVNTCYKNTLIVITRLEFSLCDFQEEGLIVGTMEWAAKAFDFKCPHIEVKYQRDINRYIYDFNSAGPKKEPMRFLNFEITGIYLGWFDIKFITKERQVEISVSNAWENDSPKYFLKMIFGFLINESTDGYVVFDDEPGIYVVCLEKTKDYKLSILHSKSDNAKWTKAGLYGELKQKDVEALMPGIEELFSVEGFSLKTFARTVLRSFEEYSLPEHRRNYEVNWMEFPEEEFLALHNLLIMGE